MLFYLNLQKTLPNTEMLKLNPHPCHQMRLYEIIAEVEFRYEQRLSKHTIKYTVCARDPDIAQTLFNNAFKKDSKVVNLELNSIQELNSTLLAVEGLKGTLSEGWKINEKGLWYKGTDGEEVNSNWIQDENEVWHNLNSPKE